MPRPGERDSQLHPMPRLQRIEKGVREQRQGAIGGVRHDDEVIGEEKLRGVGAQIRRIGDVFPSPPKSEVPVEAEVS